MKYSLQRLLIILGLVIIPFYEIFLRLLPFVRNMATDSRIPKEYIALILALSIGLLAVWQGKIKPFRNKFLIIIPIYLLFNFIMAPYAPLSINGVEVGDFYFWKPFSQVLIFGLMIFAIASIEESPDEIIRIMVICGSVMAGYVLLQDMGLDQFWVAKKGGEFTSVHAHRLGGNLGQPTLVGSFIVMIVPLAFYLKRYWLGLLMTVAVILTQSMAAIIALGVLGVCALLYFGKPIRVSVVIILLLGIFFGISFIFKSVNLRESIKSRMDGRYEVWTNIIKDIHQGQIQEGVNFSFTGVGFGRFGFIFPDKYKSSFQQAHNDPLEFIYNCGIFGGFLLLAGIFIMLFHIHLTPIVFAIFLSFIAIFVCSLTSFPFQLGSHQFYSAILVGLLHNEKITRRIV